MLVIYTAIIGPAGDRLRALPFVPDDNSKAVAFLDDEALEGLGRPGEIWNGWELRTPARCLSANPRRQARQHKLMPHELFPEAEATLWIDGCLTPRVPIRQLVDRYLTGGIDMATFRHMERNCVYQEAEACLKMRKDSPELIRLQVARYREEGYPSGMGLAETTAVLRRHTNEIRAFNHRWWTELSTGSLRDQLSFDYSCWYCGIRYRHLEGCRIDSPLFHWTQHRNRRRVRQD